MKPTVFLSSPTCSSRGSRSRTSSTSRATPARPPPRSTTGGAGRSRATSSNGSRCRSGVPASCVGTQDSAYLQPVFASAPWQGAFSRRVRIPPSNSLLRLVARAVHGGNDVVAVIRAWYDPAPAGHGAHAAALPGKGRTDGVAPLGCPLGSPRARRTRWRLERVQGLSGGGEGPQGYDPVLVDDAHPLRHLDQRS